jgi:hypothetical protein
MRLATLVERGKRDMKNIGKLDRGLLIKVILPPLDKYILFQPAKRPSFFSMTPSQIYLALKEALNRKPKYFKRKEETLITKIPVKPSHY